MMTQLGNKKNVKIISLAVAGVFVVSIAGYALMSMGDVANAAPASNIGVVDQQQVVSGNTALSSQYQQKMMETADAMQKDFDAQSQNMSEADKEKLFSTMQEQFNQKRQGIEKDIQNKVDGAVKDVASKKGLSLVVDKNAVIYGGTDITKDVSTSLDKSVSASSAAASAQQ